MHISRMRTAAVGLLTLALLTASAGSAQAPQGVVGEVRAKGDVSGDWQGTLQLGKPLRTIVRFAKADKGWTAKFYSIDQSGQAINASTVMVDGASVRIGLDIAGIEYVGTVGADGGSIVGTFSQNGRQAPLTLVRATKETAWEIPAPPGPEKMMPPDAQPGFDVATIKPNASGGVILQGLRFNGRSFESRNASLGDLIGFAYNVQLKQIAGAPDWLSRERYDISGVPDIAGIPNIQQMRIMTRKLLQDRFKLTFHMEQRELAAFVLSAGKGGQKLKPTQLTTSGPGVAFRPGKGGLTLVFANGTMSEFASTLQTIVVDRPVVDQTGIEGRYDFSLTFSPDDSQFNGHPPVATKADGSEAAPGLSEAIQQDLGLKLDSQKAEVPVIAIDHVEKPSAN